MADIIQTKEVLKEYFQTGDIPIEQQYRNLIESLRHVHDKISLEGLNLEGYDEEGERDNNLFVRLGDFVDASNGTKMIIDDTNAEITFKGKIKSEDDIDAAGRYITAGSFIGDGSQLTNLPTSIPLNVAYTDTDNNFVAAQTISNSAPAFNLKDSNAANTSEISGYLYYRDSTNSSGAYVGMTNDNLELWSRNGAIKLKVSTEFESQATFNEDAFFTGDTELGRTSITGDAEFNGSLTTKGAVQFKRADNTRIITVSDGSTISASNHVNIQADNSYLSLKAPNNGLNFIGNNHEFYDATQTHLRYVIDNSGNHDFKTGTATFGGSISANAGIDASGQTITAGNFIGDGSQLTNITAAMPLNTAYTDANNNFTSSQTIENYLHIRGASTGGAIGFNRNTDTGTILNPLYGAFQLQTIADGKFELQRYNSSGGSLGSALSIDLNTALTNFNGLINANAGIDASGQAVMAQSFTATNGTDNVDLHYYGVEFNRVLNYLRPSSGTVKDLRIGGASKGDNDWGNVFIYTTGTDDFRWNDNIIATQAYVNSQLESNDTLQEINDNGATTTNSITAPSYIASSGSISLQSSSTTFGAVLFNDGANVGGIFYDHLTDTMNFRAGNVSNSLQLNATEFIVNRTLTTNAGIDAFGQTVVADNFIGNWSGKTESDFMRATGNVIESINGHKTFTDQGIVFGTEGQDNGIKINGDTGEFLTINKSISGEVTFETDVEAEFLFTGEAVANSFKLKNGLQTAPSSATDTGTQGEIRYTADYIYVCTAGNTWKRTALSTW